MALHSTCSAQNCSCHELATAVSKCGLASLKDEEQEESGSTPWQSVVSLAFIACWAALLCNLAWVVVLERRRFHRQGIFQEGKFIAYLKYRFSSWYSWTSGSSTVVLCGLSMTLLATGGLLNSLFTSTAISESLWTAWIWIAAPDGGGSAQPGGYLVGMMVSLGGMLIFALLVSLISSSFEDILSHFRHGTIPVLEGGHIVIIGWKPMTLEIINEVCTAEAERGGRIIVVLGTPPKPDMDDQIRDRQFNFRGSSCVIRSGDPTCKDDLESVAVGSASVVLVLANAEFCREEADSHTLNVLLALHQQRWPARSNALLVVECCLVRNQALFQSLAVVRTEVVVVQDFFGELLVESAQQRGLSSIINALIGFEGDEFYIARVKNIRGKTFGELVLAFRSAILVGYINEGSKQDVCLLPTMEYEFQGTESLVLLAEDITTLPDTVPSVSTGKLCVQPADSTSLEIRTAEETERELIIIIGWNSAIGAIVIRLDHIVAPGSHIIVYSPVDIEQRKTFLEAAQNRRNHSLCNLVVTHVQGSLGARYKLEQLPIEQAKRVFVLSDSCAPSSNEADKMTTAVVLQVRSILSERPSTIETGLVIVPQLLSGTAADTIRHTGLSDYIDSNRLSACVLASVCQTPELNAVFHAILSEQGVHLCIRMLKDYLEISSSGNRAVRFDEVTIAAAARGEIALGWTINCNSLRNGECTISGGPDLGIEGAIELNPKRKDLPCICSPHDRVVILAHNHRGHFQETHETQVHASLERAQEPIEPGRKRTREFPNTIGASLHWSCGGQLQDEVSAVAPGQKRMKN